MNKLPSSPPIKRIVLGLFLGGAVRKKGSCGGLNERELMIR
jgi:hypothetical protein